jgi:pyruvate,water dikinase
VAANIGRLRALPLAAMADDELARTLIEALSITMRHWHIEGQVDGPGLLALREFAAWYQKRFPHQAEQASYRLLQAQMHTPLEATRKLWELTQLVTPAVAALLRAGRQEALTEPFRSAFATFLDRYGCRTEQMYDIGSPTWLEEPAPVLARILRAAEEGMPDPREAATRLAGEAEALAAAVGSSLSAEEAAEFQTLLDRARAATRAKEEHKLWIEQLTPGSVRTICAELARRMTGLGLLAEAAEVAFVTLAELIQFGFGLAQPQLEALIADRRAEHSRNRQVRPAPWLGANPDEPEDAQPVAVEAEQPKELKGRGAVPGVVTGVARVLTDPADTALLRRGEILVCPWTDPDWTPLLAVASAIVTETGGVVSHAAVVAREFGLPAVVGAAGATKLITTGQLVRVDGTTGIVTLQP